MRQSWVVVVSLTLSLTAVTEDNASKPKLSDDPLKPEQIAVYRAVIEYYAKGSDGALNLASRTEPLDQSRALSDKACFKGIQLEVAKTSLLVVHRLDPSVAPKTRIAMVDSDRQQEMIEKNDPQNLVKKVIDDHESVTDKQVDEAVKQALETALFTLSEIVFDKEHRRAVVAYSFVCGTLCGNGSTLVLRKGGNGWEVVKRCGEWVS
jgi:hypothetical protein